MRGMDRNELINVLRGWHKAFIRMGKGHERNVQALAEAADMLVQGKWISVEDRLPEEGQSVIVHYLDGWMPIAHLLNGKWYQSGGETSWLSVTHWMPLPEPPKEE